MRGDHFPVASRFKSASIFPLGLTGSFFRLHQPTMNSVAAQACYPPRVWGRAVVDLDEGAVGLFQPIRRVGRLWQRDGPYFTQGVGVIRCAGGGLYQSMFCARDLDGTALVGLHQPSSRVAKPTSVVYVLADTLLDADPDVDVVPIELEVSFDEDYINGLIFAARVTWAVPGFVIIFIASVGKGKCIPVRKRQIGAGQRRGTL